MMTIEEQLELAERIARQRHAGQTDKGGHPETEHEMPVITAEPSPDGHPYLPEEWEDD